MIDFFRNNDCGKHHFENYSIKKIKTCKQSFSDFPYKTNVYVVEKAVCEHKGCRKQDKRERKIKKSTKTEEELFEKLKKSLGVKNEEV